MEDLTAPNLSAPLGTACGVTNPVFNSTITDAEISASPDCQRRTLLNYFQNNFGENEACRWITSSATLRFSDART